MSRIDFTGSHRKSEKNSNKQKPCLQNLKKKRKNKLKFPENMNSFLCNEEEHFLMTWEKK